MIDHYQTIPELNIKGRINTPEEFDKIGLPKDLKGQTVLDIGCNAGAYLLECRKRGAKHLVGVEPNEHWKQIADKVLSSNNDFEIYPYVYADKIFHKLSGF